MVSRNYSDKDLKLLWGRSAGRCSFPRCAIVCMIEGTPADRDAVIGKVAHIESASDSGPRANPALDPRDRDRYENLILLCGNHHDLVDQQPNTYSAADLRRWKHEHEQAVAGALAKAVSTVTFDELEQVCSVILSHPSLPTADFSIVDVTEKMDRNAITRESLNLLTLGLARAPEVREYISTRVVTDSAFPERLKAGFIEEYERLVSLGLQGDSLFYELFQFTAGGSTDFLRRAAGLTVLSYLFLVCEVFDK